MAGWSKEQDEILKRLWNEGKTCSEIACSLPGKSRNAVIGRRVRMGLPDRDASKAKRSRGGRPRSDILRPARSPHNGHIALPEHIRQLRALSEEMKRAERPLPKVLETVEPLNLLLIELTESQCKWPVNEGDPFLFCGHPKAEGSPYCSQHHARAYAGAPRPNTFKYRRAA